MARELVTVVKSICDLCKRETETARLFWQWEENTVPMQVDFCANCPAHTSVQDLLDLSVIAERAGTRGRPAKAVEGVTLKKSRRPSTLGIFPCRFERCGKILDTVSGRNGHETSAHRHDIEAGLTRVVS